ncbi:MAG: hypothetical protein R2701_13370 [Acidimicrobiales bacterium]
MALAPAIGALVGMGAHDLWQRRDHRWARVALGVAVAGSGWWAWTLLQRAEDWTPWLQPVVLFGSLGVGALIAASPTLRGRMGVALAAAAAVLALAGPLPTASRPRPTRTPARSPQRPRRRGGFGAGPVVAAWVATVDLPAPRTAVAASPAGSPGRDRRQRDGERHPDRAPGLGGGTTGGGGAGGLLSASTPSDEVTSLLQQDAGQFRWVAAAVGLELGVWLPARRRRAGHGDRRLQRSDPSPTLEQFQQYVADGDIHWFISGGGGLGGRGGNQMGGSSASSEISTWVQENFTSTTVDGVTLYDLTSPTT